MKSNFNPLVSIVIPVYNGSNYVSEAIDSALAQTYKNIEIIVVNDGSTDNSEEIIKSYGNKLRYFKKENGGVSTALNLGIKKAKGEYISWLSHDDLYYPDKIEKQIEEFKKTTNENIILYSDFCEVDQNKKFIRNVDLPELAPDLIRPFLSFGSSLYLHGCTLLIPKFLLIKYGLFDISKKYTQDYYLWFKFASFVKYIHVSKRLVKSRIHPEQDSNKGGDLKIKEVDVVRSEFIKELSKKEINAYFNNVADFWNVYKTYDDLGFKMISKSIYEKIEIFFHSSMIPKKIHFFWFGDGELSELHKKCIESWKKYAPDFEIIKWDESNCNVKENQYAYEAYKNKKWAFVSDYFRFKILYQHGGFYCDTDTEITHSINELRQYNFFLGFEKKEYVQVGFFGSVKKSIVLKKILDSYKNDFFVKSNGDLRTDFTSPMRMTELLSTKFGLKLDGSKQLLQKNIMVYPMNFFTIDVNDGNNFTKHYYDNSWGNKSIIPYSYILTKEFFKEILSSEGVICKSVFLARIKCNEQLYLDRFYSKGIIGRLIVRVYLKIKKIIVFLKNDK